jgi:hypothetical protein
MVYNMHVCNVMHQKKIEKEKKGQGETGSREHGRSTEGGKCEWN